MKCPDCGSERVKKAGKYKGKYRTSQGYRCKDCNRYFVERDGFEGKHYPKEVIVQALHLYVEGLSLSKIRDFLWQHFGYRPSDHAMLSWVKEYSELIERFERKQKPEIKGRMHVDEVFVEVRGRRHCVIHTVDSRTGYCPEAVLSERRDLEAYDGFFARLKKRLGGQIRGVFEREREKPPKERRLVTFVSDKWGAIKCAFNRYFYRIARLVHGVPIACKQFGLRFNNNPIERRNGDLKQRYKVMRSFKSFRSAQAFVRLYRAIVNFVRHGNRETPAHRAGVWPGLGRDRLADLISIAAR
ncbi:MAG: DDE-type integrase/transposase/recombinase [Candidatus Hadarchaeum sp.]|uniref:DDE-type integrase/transposase/recombinase n=1 Tax=Candidatus Hadarchaeum sp. TaxID=2883567 RepID=UPI003D121271